MFSEMGTTTIMMCLFFGVNALLFTLFQLIKQKTVTEINDKKEMPKQKEMSKAFNGTVECFTNLTSELFRTGLIMTLTYLCENYPIFAHSTKSYSRDAFTFILIIFFGYAFMTIKPVHDLSLLGREQTEEWKGWMQFIFLLYHYFHAEEVYNSVRVMITCYVWMTGFGNFSFFYMKQDYGWLRVVQMLWRLNFSVLLLMWTHGNTYILYYICPMHTFYFLMVYATMYAFSEVNHSKWGVRVKLMIVGLLIFTLWDINYGMFDFLFGWLGTDKVVGASNGSLWEWYFRTSLDKYSTFFGMIFALNFPIAEQYFTRAKGGPTIIAATILGSLTIWWFFYFYTLPKLEYNMSHAYLSIIPLLSYIFFRNITPYVRSGVCMSLHELGKTTLETYLLQHHIWLTSNAKTLLTLVPDHPYINFAFATILFFFVSKELYRLTMSLRGMVLPDDKDLALRNLIFTVITIIFLYIFSVLVELFGSCFFSITASISIIFVVSILLIKQFALSTSDNILFQSYSLKFCILAVIFIILGGFIKFSEPSLPMSLSIVKSNLALLPLASKPSIDVCYSSLLKGHWEIQPCSSQSSTAMCEMELWMWDTTNCPIRSLANNELQKIFHNKKLIFLGDSMLRNVYHAMNSLIDSTYIENEDPSQKHADQVFVSTSSNITLDFFWTPFVQNITEKLMDIRPSECEMVVLGATAWDALYTRNISMYSDHLDELSKVVSTFVDSSYILWLLPTTIIDSRLIGTDKRQYMTEAIIETYRVAYTLSHLQRLVSITINPSTVSLHQEASSTDGVHYGSKVSKVIAQMVSNAYLLKNPTALTEEQVVSSSPSRTGSMGHPGYGTVVLIVSFIMIFFMDSFFGIGVLSLYLFGRRLDWDAAYLPLLKQIGVPFPFIEHSNLHGTDIEGSEEESENEGSSVPLLVNRM